MTTKRFNPDLFKKLEPREVGILAIRMNCSNTWKETYITDSLVIANSTTYQYYSRCYDEEKGEVISGQGLRNTKI